MSQHTVRTIATGEYSCTCGAVWDKDEGEECPASKPLSKHIDPCTARIEAILSAERECRHGLQVTISELRTELAAIKAQEPVAGLSSAREIIRLLVYLFGGQAAVRTGEKGAEHRRQAQNKAFKWLEANRVADHE